MSYLLSVYPSLNIVQAQAKNMTYDIETRDENYCGERYSTNYQIFAKKAYASSYEVRSENMFCGPEFPNLGTNAVIVPEKFVCVQPRSKTVASAD